MNTARSTQAPTASLKKGSIGSSDASGAQSDVEKEQQLSDFLEQKLALNTKILELQAELKLQKVDLCQKLVKDYDIAPEDTWPNGVPRKKRAKNKSAKKGTATTKPPKKSKTEVHKPAASSELAAPTVSVVVDAK